MANLQTFDISAHLQDLETVAAYLDACLEEGGQELFLAGLGHVMKSHGMSEIVARAGLEVAVALTAPFQAAVILSSHP